MVNIYLYVYLIINLYLNFIKVVSKLFVLMKHSIKTLINEYANYLLYLNIISVLNK